MFGHLAFLAADILIYVSLAWLIFDAIGAWIAYYCYMTLSKFAIYGYIGFLGYQTVSGLLGLLMALKSGIWGIVMYPAQMAMYIFGCYHLYLHVMELNKAMQKHRQEGGDVETGKKS